MTLNIILLSFFFLLIIFSIGHLLYKISNKEVEKNQMFWIWIIIGLPLFGSLAYFTFNSKANLKKRGFLERH